MRLIELREFEKRPIRLTSNELDELLTAGPPAGLSVRLVAAEEQELRAGSIVGTVVLPSLRILIRPKVSLANVFFLLGFDPRLVQFAKTQFPFETEPDLLQILAWIYDNEVAVASRRGIVRGYEPREEALLTLRGRIDIARQIRLHQDRPIPLESRFDEYTQDIALNRVLKAAMHTLLGMSEVERSVARRLQYRRLQFGEVEDAIFPPIAVPELTFTRLTDHWETAGNLARLILQHRTVRDRAGSLLGTSFTVDMNKVFERFIERIVREEAMKSGWGFARQAARVFVKGVEMRPDLVIRMRGRDVAVGDAKYKTLSEELGWPHADLYQLLAYCSALGLPRGLLIYATRQRHKMRTVEQAGIELATVGIDLSGSRDDVLREAQAAARVLLDQAQRNTDYYMRGMA